MRMGMITTMTNVLFVCGKCRHRSPTAQHVFAGLDGYETDCAGLSRDADLVLDSEQVEWADIFVVMEKRQIARLKRSFPARIGGKKIVSLDIPDQYEFMQPELIAKLKERQGRFVRG